jgi:small conductance mechanosensitive channel
MILAVGKVPIHLAPQRLSTAWDSANHIVSTFVKLLPNLALAFVVFTLFVILAKVCKWIFERMGKGRHMRPNAAVLLGKLAQLVVLIAGFLIAIPIISPSFTFGNLITTLGISTVAIGFAFQNILQNFLAGLLLLLHEPFQVGDHITVTGFEGEVKEIQGRATIIETNDATHVVVPNSTLFMNPVVVRDAQTAPQSAPQKAASQQPAAQA